MFAHQPFDISKIRTIFQLIRACKLTADPALPTIVGCESEGRRISNDVHFALAQTDLQ